MTNILKKAKQPNLLISLPAVLARILAGVIARIKPIFFSGEAGTGKTTAARTVAEALGWNFVQLPSTISLSKFEALLEEHCSIVSPRPNLWFIDEFHHLAPEVRELLLRLTDSSGESIQGGKAEKEWLYSQSSNFMIFASNHGDADPAMVGPNGRCEVIEILPLSREDRLVVAWEVAREAKRIYSVRFKPAAMDAALAFCSHVARNVTNRIMQLAECAANNNNQWLTRADVLAYADSLKWGLEGLDAGDMRILAYLAPYGQAGDLYRRILAQTMPQADKLFKSSMARLTNKGLVTVSTKGHKQCITNKGIELLEKGDAL